MYNLVFEVDLSLSCLSVTLTHTCVSWGVCYCCDWTGWVERTGCCQGWAPGVLCVQGPEWHWEKFRENRVQERGHTTLHTKPRQPIRGQSGGCWPMRARLSPPSEATLTLSFIPGVLWWASPLSIRSLLKLLLTLHASIDTLWHMTLLTGISPEAQFCIIYTARLFIN